MHQSQTLITERLCGFKSHLGYDMNVKWIVGYYDPNAEEDHNLVITLRSSYDDAYKVWNQICDSTIPIADSDFQCFIDSHNEDDISIALPGFDYWSYQYDDFKEYFTVSCVTFQEPDPELDPLDYPPYKFVHFNETELKELYETFKRMEIVT